MESKEPLKIIAIYYMITKLKRKNNCAEKKQRIQGQTMHCYNFLICLMCKMAKTLLNNCVETTRIKGGRSRNFFQVFQFVGVNDGENFLK